MRPPEGCKLLLEVCRPGTGDTGRGLLRRPPDVPGWQGVRPGVGVLWTDGCCGRERVVGGVDGGPVLCSTRR